MPINHDDEFHGPINEGNRFPDDWSFINSNLDNSFTKTNKGEHETVSDQPNWFKDGNLSKYYEVERG